MGGKIQNATPRTAETFHTFLGFSSQCSARLWGGCQVKFNAYFLILEIQFLILENEFLILQNVVFFNMRN